MKSETKDRTRTAIIPPGFVWEKGRHRGRFLGRTDDASVEVLLCFGAQNFGVVVGVGRGDGGRIAYLRGISSVIVFLNNFVFFKSYFPLILLCDLVIFKF